MGNDVTPVILSGGSGTRLWPLSLPGRPKQLHALVGEETMLQATARRVETYAAATSPVVVCNEVQVEEVVEQLGSIGYRPHPVVVEPVGRNTAPAVAAAALLLDPDAVMVVLPADHLIEDTAGFRTALDVAVRAAREGFLVTFGVVPTRPETGFGYIEVGEQHRETADVARFVEKPELAAAVEYVASGYLWNSGMFAFTAGRIREELDRWAPDVLGSVELAVSRAVRTGEAVRLGEQFAKAPSISLDYAVMERTKHARVVPLDAGWSDVGSWQALWEMLAHGGGTVTVGDVHVIDVEDSYVRSGSRPVAVIGLDDVVVVETPEAVLVVSRHRAQDVRAAAEWFDRLRGGLA